MNLKLHCTVSALEAKALTEWLRTLGRLLTVVIMVILIYQGVPLHDITTGAWQGR
jgi:hypothetical protein